MRLIGERFSELCELPLAINILEALECPTQMGLSRVDRRENIKDKFRLIGPYYAEGKSFLVLDDVFTTGSTLDEVISTPKHSYFGAIGCGGISRSTVSVLKKEGVP